MRIFAISDLHTDFTENWRALQQISSLHYRDDAVVVAGDIADDLGVIEKTLGRLQTKFRQVFYVPGNHELWVRTDQCHSLEKFSRILALCNDLGIHTHPAQAGEVWVVPLFSWYEPDYDIDNSADISELEGWADFYLCKWPEEIESVSDYFLKINEPHIRPYNGPVITLSHFLPRRDLLPPTSSLRFKGLPRVAGCLALDRQIRALNSVVHVFGHSHINCDLVIDGVRYVQNIGGYPRESELPGFRLKLIWDGYTQVAADSGCQNVS
jgi:hypothetical protein